VRKGTDAQDGEAFGLTAFPVALEKLFPVGTSTQCLVVVGEEKAGSTGIVLAFGKASGTWHLALSPMEASVGRTGLTTGAAKKEGDGHTPSGVYAGLAFGHAPRSIRKCCRQTDDDIIQLMTRNR
jgi:L,D-peptidoglycan transpeptidase YkuD (ErfK/YbiS/YcfS/YnhG family)